MKKRSISDRMRARLAKQQRVPAHLQGRMRAIFEAQGKGQDLVPEDETLDPVEGEQDASHGQGLGKIR